MSHVHKKSTLNWWGVLWVGLVAGCSDGSERFFIVQNQIPQSGCVIPGTHGSNYRGKGLLDVALVGEGSSTAYDLFPLLQNDLPAMGKSGGTEPNRITLREFQVRLELAQGAPQTVQDLFASADLRSQLTYSEPWAGTVEPAGSSLSAQVKVVPAVVAQKLRETKVLETISYIGLTARVRAVGSTLDDSLVSREFVYPIEVCEGCLVASISQCPSTPTNKGHVCNVAQDEPVDCCDDGKLLVCPSRRPSTN